MKGCFYFLLGSSLVSCGPDITEIQYNSPDTVTGGFSNFSLKLNADKRTFLVFGVAKLTGETEAGGVYEWQIDTVAMGTWTARNDKISVDFESGSNVIRSAFSNNKSMAIKENRIIFDRGMDTLLINNIPCISNEIRN